MISDNYDKRAISLGGYGTAVPFHGVHSYDPYQSDDSAIIELGIGDGWVGPDTVLKFLQKVESTLDGGTNRGELFYSFQCQTFGYHASGITQLKEDIRSPFSLGEDLQGTVENRYGGSFEMHRPCFVILTPVEGGLFYLFLRSGKSFNDRDTDDWDVAYDTISGILMNNEVASWPNVEAIIGDRGGGPIPQVRTPVTTAKVGGREVQELEEVYPLDQENTGDADIIAAKNPFASSDVDSNDSDVVEAIENIQHLTYRVKGGTIGFDKEESFTINSFTAYRPQKISLRGFPLVICSPMCTANPAE